MHVHAFFLHFSPLKVYINVFVLHGSCVYILVPATKVNTITKSNLGQCVSKYDLLVWFEISELEPTGE